MPDRVDATTPLAPSDAAELVLSFVNTRAIAGSLERLAAGALMADWLAEVGLMQADTVVTDADAATARELREALVGVLLAHSGAASDGAAEAQLRRSGQQHPLLPIINSAGASFLPAQTGAPAAMAAVLAAAAEVALRGTWQRVKACRNPRCQRGFYDRSRNGSGAYCTPNRCGAQIAMRAYRARRDAR